jgi:hypothetical protein
MRDVKSSRSLWCIFGFFVDGVTIGGDLSSNFALLNRKPCAVQVTLQVQKQAKSVPLPLVEERGIFFLSDPVSPFK